MSGIIERPEPVDRRSACDEAGVDAGPARGGDIEAALDAARDVLGMDVACVSDTRRGVLDYRAVRGDGESFLVAVGHPVALEGTYCERLLDGRLAGIVRDAAAEPLVADLAITRLTPIGSYIGVPVVLPGGEVYGTLCCFSHAPNPDLQDGDLEFLGVMARVIAGELDRVIREAERREAAAAAHQVAALLAALEARDGATERHSRAVVDLAVAVAAELGVDDCRLTEVERAALLHDIGKLGVSDAVLRKPSRLDGREWLEMRRHPVIGERIVASMPALAPLSPVIRAEHERWDGNGYPDGLRGDHIPLMSRVVFACDAYHAMTSDRPYRPALSREQALRELQRGAGTQFCPRTVGALLAVLDRRARRFGRPALHAVPGFAWQPPERHRDVG
jgi:hypothetical protein